jgi:hypothetical protein
MLPASLAGSASILRSLDFGSACAKARLSLIGAIEKKHVQFHTFMSQVLADPAKLAGSISYILGIIRLSLAFAQADPKSSDRRISWQRSIPANRIYVPP